MIYQSNCYMPQIGIEETKIQGLTNNVLRMHFLNGSIDIIEKQYGAYAICPGCGSGKTTNIKNLIALRWYEGILYAAFTKDELNEMYQFCKTLVGRKAYDRINGVEHELKIEDILVLHSDFNAEGTDNNLWRNHPEELANKKIILCTHAKLLNEPLHILINANFNMRTANLISPLRAAANGSSNSTLPRQWVIIDESTEAKPLTSRVRKLVLHGIAAVEMRERTIEESNEFTLIGKSEKRSVPMFIKPSSLYAEFREFVRVISTSSPLYSDVCREERCELDKIRNEQMIQALYYNFERYANMPNTDYVNVAFSYTDVVNPDMKFHLLLFDGTSDITLKGSTIYELDTYNNKYNGQTNIFEFSFNLNRRIKYDGTDQDAILRSKLDKVANDMENIIRQNNKTLIFTWRNFKIDNSEANDDIDEGLIAKNEESLSLNDKFSIPSYISMRLREKGLIEGQNFSIEYYGSGKDKATNQFRDYDAVVMLGRYNVPGYVIDEFNIMNHCNITSTEYYANRMVQAICRSRIRLHNGLPINVYISNDWSRDVIDYVDTYMNAGKTTRVFNAPTQGFIEECYNRLRAIGITPKKAEQIARICQLDRHILLFIETKRKYRTRISLSDLFSVLPMTEKKISKYIRIVESLNRLGIELIIENGLNI